MNSTVYPQVAVKMYIYGINSRDINRFMPHIESGYVYPARQSYTFLVMKDERGEVYKSVVKQGREYTVRGIATKYQNNTIDVQDILETNEQITATIISNKHRRAYDCESLERSNYPLLYTNLICGTDLPKGKPVPTMGEYSLVLTILLIMAVFWNRINCLFLRR